MPKLTRDFAKLATETAETTSDEGFEKLELPGFYLLRLLNDPETGEGPAGPLWKWKFATVHEDGTDGVWVFNTTSLSQKAIGRLGKVFAAFGVPADTDTESLVGKMVSAQLVEGDPDKNGKRWPGIKSFHPASDHEFYKGVGTGKTVTAADYGIDEPSTAAQRRTGSDQPF